jgi:hypothetical protein
MRWCAVSRVPMAWHRFCPLFAPGAVFRVPPPD